LLEPPLIAVPEDQYFKFSAATTKMFESHTQGECLIAIVCVCSGAYA